MNVLTPMATNQFLTLDIGELEQCINELVDAMKVILTVSGDPSVACSRHIDMITGKDSTSGITKANWQAVWEIKMREALEQQFLNCLAEEERKKRTLSPASFQATHHLTKTATRIKKQYNV